MPAGSLIQVLTRLSGRLLVQITLPGRRGGLVGLAAGRARDAGPLLAIVLICLALLVLSHVREPSAFCDL